MKRAVVVLGVAAAVACGGFLPAETVSVSLNPAKVVGRVDEKVYGHFLEHIYHSVNGGLWGEMIWNRSFEESPGDGRWSVVDDCLVQLGQESDVRMVFGEPTWGDYEYTLEAEKIGGREGFLILFRVAGDADFYWYNFGGWGNQRHALERGDTGRRQRAAAPAVDGTIEPNRWYRIRVRCEGPRIQVWLDETRILDFTDREHPHLAGQVGVGTWATQARYRKFKVTALDGKPLLTGLPPAVAPAAVGKYWEGYGQGAFSLSGDDPLNGEIAQQVTCEGPEAGFQQTPLCLRSGEAYDGSLWARGDAPGGLVVRLLDGEKTLQEVPLPAPSATWHEYPFQFRCDATAQNAAIQVGVKGKGKIWLDQVSLMSASSKATGGYRPDLLEAIADLKPPIIRWPGGCFAEWYRWKDGVGPQHRRVKYPRSIWDDVDVNSFGTDEFVALCRRVGAEPLIVVDIGSHEPPERRPEYVREACDWIRYCNDPATSPWGRRRAANGHPEPYGVTYWEIDNETWFMGAEAYVQAVCEFAPAMRKADPAIKIAACGSGGTSATGRGLEWNRIVLASCAEHFDYLSTHHYEQPENFATGPAGDEVFYRQTAELIAASANPKIKIYCSEWNAQSTDWRTGLYAGGILNVFERSGDFFEIGGPALFLRHVSATRWDNAFINFDHHRWFPAPNYVVMKLWRDHYAPDRIELTGRAGPLNLVATKAADGQTVYLKAVNPGDQPVPLEITVNDAFPVRAAAAQLVAAGSLEARNTLDAPGRIEVVQEHVETRGQTVRLTLPRWSAAVVTVH